MQVAILCYAALAGSGHIPLDDALELQLFELQQKILCQAHSLAKKSPAWQVIMLLRRG